MTPPPSTVVAPWPPALAEPPVAARLRELARTAIEDVLGCPLVPDAAVDVTWSPNRVQVCLDGFCIELGASSQRLSLEDAVLNAAVALGESFVGF